MQITIDEHAGVCPGVQRAIAQAEAFLEKNEELISIGPIIHNPVEVARLAKIGLRHLDQKQIEEGDLSEYKDAAALIRTHGVSEALKRKLEASFASVLDATCPIVQNVQRLVKHYCDGGYQIVIAGKKEHPEVLGLRSYCPDNSIALQSVQEIEGSVDYDKKTVLVAQTTISSDIFADICEHLSAHISTLIVKNTTCNVVANRGETISAFASSNDIVIFVGGRNSSNSRMLFSVCQSVNSNAHWIENAEELSEDWFVGVRKIGVTGGASTPLWLLQRVSDTIEKITRSGE